MVGPHLSSSSTTHAPKRPQRLTTKKNGRSLCLPESAMSTPSATLHPSSVFPSLSTNRLKNCRGRVRCGLTDFIGGDLVKPDLGKWLDDVEKYKALAVYSPHEGGYEGRYLNRLRYKGYRFLDLTARGLGDPEATLTKVHPVCPVRILNLKRFSE